MKHAFIALGGNIGEVAITFNSARVEIAALPHTTVTASSLLFRTPPLGPPGQPDYYNAVIAITTGLAPLALLDALQSIEHRHGRVRTVRWGARTLDLDIIAIATEIIALPRLSIPHPLMHTRQFVLRPLCDIAPEWHHPQLGEPASSLLADLLRHGEAPLAEGRIW
ncbi:MAG: 2-amino-4-hydroxy-6-hydroxymethyldihydropteridine diphosphokinase [Zetaproteobacteria bacterium CG12_big_fil_rev_8_21_14_0_65_54_13]|nr:MAG: 2-amino-4-hydroxy-6-hydroxymethyldihydropteridine diphosphokinase [Zetaproteobacteria bacterium CG12_big_fil_rev_8_21_14_0_65_54_13]PIX55770.1 MAG: 2-amino-4-hydroxy-6-hydroxymethyldihydropteridine diphosphokinase [Zetaproteobacteria bacterium CG_4_10_14_3_um_filter_54_28]PJA30472.1 MAG: 2-amino-4-hydroxy-6-hydroxymethyldihydropteridine diphosphokinase [Zetaproteobacteria bacterium CG_4_9_14_3_um_filter_54_145]